jgi:hypothetical protein
MTVRPFHHIGYVVDDLPTAADAFARTVGAGPFHSLGHVALDDASYRGAEAHYDHETAFGRWGALLVELSVIHAAQPDGLARFMGAGRAPGIGHAAWIVEDLEAESAALRQAGLKLVHAGGAGPVRAHWHDGGPLFGHPVEVLRACPEIFALYDAVAAAAEGWDGRDPLRPAPAPRGAPA